jgi:hypothetical protein
VIARNYVKHPEALAFQRELFAFGVRNSIMVRLASVIMRSPNEAPAWFAAMRQRARKLAMAVRIACRDWLLDTWAASGQQRSWN